MSMGQQLGSGTKPGATAGMTPSAMNQALPGTQPGKPPANQLQRAMAPTTAVGPVAPSAPSPLMGTMRPGMGPVAPGAMPQQNIAYENRALNQQTGQTQANQQSARLGQKQPYVNPNSVGLRQMGVFNR